MRPLFSLVLVTLCIASAQAQHLDDRAVGMWGVASPDSVYIFGLWLKPDGTDRTVLAYADDTIEPPTYNEGVWWVGGPRLCVETRVWWDGKPLDRSERLFGNNGWPTSCFEWLGKHHRLVQRNSEGGDDVYLPLTEADDRLRRLLERGGRWPVKRRAVPRRR